MLDQEEKAHLEDRLSSVSKALNESEESLARASDQAALSMRESSAMRDENVRLSLRVEAAENRLGIAWKVSDFISGWRAPQSMPSNRQSYK